MTTPLSVQGITKWYGALCALHDVSFSIPKGITGLVGPNGAGKTTLVRILLGLLKPTNGSADIMGCSLGDPTIRQFVGYMSEKDSFIPDVTAKKYLTHLGQLSGLSRMESLQRAHDISALLDLSERHRLIKTYSKGMKQKVKLAQALIHSPSILLLDEPTDGLAPVPREQMLKVINELAKDQGVTVILSTHLLRDVEKIGSFLVVLDRGEVRRAASLAELMNSVHGRLMVRVNESDQCPILANKLREEGITVTERSEFVLEVLLQSTSNTDTQKKVMETASSLNTLVSIRDFQLGIEEVFTAVVTQNNGRRFE